jgi:hypothetical protein
MAESDARSRVNQSFNTQDAIRNANFTTLSPLNNSVSKQMFSFSKAGRFGERKM